MQFARDLSWLGFNLRVLEEAIDKQLNIYERMKFISIFSSNLDEFFRVRYPSVIALSGLNEKTRAKASIEISNDIAEKIQNEVNRQLELNGNILTQQIIPELKNNKINFYYNSPVRREHIREMKEIFLSNVLAFIQPIFLETDSNFLPENNKLYLVVTIKDPNSNTLKQAIVNIPSDKLKRFFVLSPIDGEEYVIFIDDIVRENIQYLFPKLEIQSVYSIKFNRNAKLNLEEEYSGNLLNKIEKQLKKRDIALPSRFLYEQGMPRNLQLFLAAVFLVKYEDMFAGGKYHHLSDLSSFPVLNTGTSPKKFKPLSASKIMGSGDIFNILEQQDILLHLPYQSYNPVLSFFNQAAVDSEVTDIYITLYRLATDSHIVNALISAAKNGKNVIVFIELKARFDEANNIRWSRIMKDAGIKLVYSLPQIKVHSKIALIKKKIDKNEMAYAILSTGNFNEMTAQFYTDHVLITSKMAVINEMIMLFDYLENGHKLNGSKLKFKELLVSQFNLIEELEKRFNIEIKKAKRKEPAYIRIKVNNLEDPHMINLLYKASKAGVKIELIIRSICCIVPGITGLSENIEVHRIIDKFLEHSRIFIFGVDEHATIFMGSADLMTRNLHHRIEVCVPVRDAICKQELLDYFKIQWSDTRKAVQLLSNSNHVAIENKNGHAINAQDSIYEYLKNRV